MSKKNVDKLVIETLYIYIYIVSHHNLEHKRKGGGGNSGMHFRNGKFFDRCNAVRGWLALVGEAGHNLYVLYCTIE